MVVVSVFVQPVFRSFELITGYSIPRLVGGRFPLKLVLRTESHDLGQNAPCSPIAVIACYSGSSQDDHQVCISSLSVAGNIC
jgi:hypothetical protein